MIYCVERYFARAIVLLASTSYFLIRPNSQGKNIKLYDACFDSYAHSNNHIRAKPSFFHISRSLRDVDLLALGSFHATSTASVIHSD